MTALLPDVLYAYSPLESDNLKIALTDHPIPLSGYLSSSPFLVSSPFEDSAPVSPFAEDGGYLRSSFDDWYYRIHVIPAELALGNLAGDVQRRVVVWNAYMHAVPFTAFTLENAEGISVSGVEPPVDAPPLEEFTYLFDVSIAGPATINATATWTIDGEQYVVPITGQRTVLFSFRPDWKLSRVMDTYEWLNTLHTTRDGTEQINRIRNHKPRRVLEYAIRIRDDDVRLADAAMFGWQGRTFGVPWWHEKTRLTADAAAGQRLLQVDTRGLSFAPDRPAVLYRGADEFENLDVEEVTPTSILVRNNLTRPWPQGSFVIPVMPAAPQTEIVTTRQLPQYMDSQFRFAAIPGETVINIPDLPPPQVYLDHELYTGETNWRGSLTIQVRSRRKEVDGITGPLRIAPKTDFPIVVRGFSWLIRGREKAQELLAFFGRREGRRVPVWIPSGVEDFKPVADVEAGSSVLLVRRHEHGRLIGRHPARRHVLLILRTGERLPRRILSVEDDGPYSAITVSPGFDAPIALTQIKRVSYLGLYRLQADAVTFSWATPEVAEVDTQFVLKKEAV